MAAAALPLLDSFSALADGTRCRMLWLLDRQELTVSELCSVLQLPQSTVSRHLKTLADAGWVASRRDGTSRYYALATGERDGARAQIWQLTRTQLAGRAGRRPGLPAGWRACWPSASRTSQQFFATTAGEWDRLREELFGGQFSWQALLGLLPADWVVGDLGCGTGATLAALAPHVGRVIGVDGSDEMLASARARVKDLLERRPQARHARSAAARGRLARCRGDDARACTTCPRPRARSPRPRACSSPAAGCSSSTCCRTSARTTGSGWAMSGSGSPTSRCGACSSRRASTPSA